MVGVAKRMNQNITWLLRVGVGVGVLGTPGDLNRFFFYQCNIFLLCYYVKPRRIKEMSPFSQFLNAKIGFINF